MGIWFLSISVEDAFGDQFARLYNVVSLPAYFALLGVVSVAAGVALLLVVRPMPRLMSGSARGRTVPHR